MGHNWKTTKLLDHYDIRSGLSKPAKDFGSGYPFLTFKDVFYNYFTPDILGDLVQSNDKERASSSVKRGDVFLTRTSETMHELGMSCVALQDYENSTFNGFCKRLRPHKESELVPEYVGYYLRSPKFRQSMLAFSTMSTRASLNNEMIGRLEISYPSKNEQLKIAKILKTLDDKVALNLQINQTLEQMAQALFKSWFVDFDPVVDNALDEGFFEQELDLPDELLRRAEARKAVRTQAGFKPLHAATRQLFPAAFEPCYEPSLGLGGWVPKGWDYKNAESVADITIGKTPPRKESQWFSEVHESNKLWVSIRDMGGFGAYTGKTSEYLTSDAVEKFNIKLVPKNSVLLSFKLTLGRVAIAREELTTNEAIAHFSAPQHGLNASFLYCYLSNFDYSVLGSTSSIATAVNSKIIKNMPILVPQDCVLDCYEKQTKNIFNQMAVLDDETVTLISLRDTLLPKLISGELSLDDVELTTQQGAA
ncbi:restriction endonuclease subunit S [Aeromonas veronii]|uniref:restriction endonuclease subunit S n=1 Tax=Aeromonas veronii TaxID=654 RepID=UPI0013024F01|nr:restriction endonuclease subunit S [Aeromonas veronii]KAE9630340.1 restriction endonuclease subunit S [Aeromonas veronii]